MCGLFLFMDILQWNSIQEPTTCLMLTPVLCYFQSEICKEVNKITQMYFAAPANYFSFAVSAVRLIWTVARVRFLSNF